jgi:hypothetical protein
MPLYFRNVGTAWNDNTSWSTTSSTGPSAGAIPSQGDDVIFDGSSALSCPISTTVGGCRDLTTTGYTGTITLNVDLAIARNHVIGASTVFAGSAFYCPIGTSSITSNGVLFPNFGLSRGSAGFFTLTLNDNLNVVNIRIDANGAATNGFAVNVNGNMGFTGNFAYAYSGTTVYNLIGTGNLGVVGATPFFSVTININTPLGIITFLSNVSINGGTLIYTAGTVVTTGNTFILNGTNTITSKNIGTGNEITFNNVTAGTGGAATTTTLGSDMRVAGNFTVAVFNGYNFNANTIFVAGNIINPVGLPNGGTSIMEMYGSSSAQITNTSATPSSATGPLTRSLIINKTGGATVTLIGGLSWGIATRIFNVNSGNSLILNGNLTIAGGTMTFLGTSTLTPNLNTLFLTTNAAKTLNTGTVTWYNVTNNTLTTLVTLSSNLNMSNNLSFTNTAGSAGCGFTGAFNVNVSGGLLANDTGVNTFLSFTGGGVVKMIGSGVIESSNEIGFTIDINTTSSGYVLGNSTRPTLLIRAPFNLLGTSIVTVFSPTLHNLSVRNGAVINTNNTPTGANLAGGTQILWGNLNSTQIGTSTVTISQPIIVQNNFTTTSATTTMTCNGAKILVRGTLNCFNLTGTSDIELDGTTAGTWGSAVQVNTITNNVTINKTSGASVSILGSITWGAAGKVLTKISGNINAGTSTITTPGVSVTINDFTFWNLIVSTGGTIIQNVLNTINNNLTLNGTATFQGTAGWDCGNLISTAAGGFFTITLQQLITYRTRLQAFITGGTIGFRTTMTSSGASNAIWTLDFGASQSMIYVNGTRIDSSQGQTIWSFGVSPANIATTINWNIGSPPGTFAYTFLN